MQYKETDDQSLTIYSEEYDEYFHCRGGALLKAQEIFLKPFKENTGNALPSANRSVLEVGFGAALNFFVTASEFVGKDTQLEYTALEKDLLPAQVFEELHYETHTSTQIVNSFIKARNQLPEPLLPDDYEIALEPNIVLQLKIGQAQAASLPPNYFDWVYLDPFSPMNNPELWTEEFIGKLYHSLKTGGGLSTYSVNGEVRRIMKRLGFKVEKRPGIPGKREVLAAWKR